MRNRAVDLMKQRLKSTKHPLVLGGLGGFGGAMRLPKLKDPVLVAGVLHHVLTDSTARHVMIGRGVSRARQLSSRRSLPAMVDLILTMLDESPAPVGAAARVPGGAT